MSTLTRAYVVVRRDDGYGEVFPLQEGTRHRLGRAPSNKIVIKDDLCSREHAEIYPEGADWAIRDLGSLNGTLVNGELLRKERVLRPLDEIRVGRTRLLFVEELGQLPEWTPENQPREAEGDGFAIRKRLGQTRYLPPAGALPIRLKPGRALLLPKRWLCYTAWRWTWPIVRLRWNCANWSLMHYSGRRLRKQPLFWR